MKDRFEMNNNLVDGVWWTDYLYDNAYEYIVSNCIKKFPIFMPSIDSPDHNFAASLAMQMSQELNWPIYVLTRDSQFADYQNALKDYQNITVFSADDQEICNAGLSRKKIQNYAISEGFDFIFMLDDDLTQFNYKTSGKTKSGLNYSKTSHKDNQIRIFAMWQLMTMYLNQTYGVSGTTTNYHATSWPHEYCTVERAVSSFPVYFCQAICTNTKELYDIGIEYRSNDLIGHEDVDYQTRSMDRGIVFAQLNFLSIVVGEYDLDTFAIGNSILERFRVQMTQVINGPDNWLSRDWITCVPTCDGTYLVHFNIDRIRELNNNTPIYFTFDCDALFKTTFSFPKVRNKDQYLSVLGYKTRQEALDAPPQTYNDAILDGKDKNGKWKIKNHKEFLVIGGNFWDKLYQIWQDLDEDFLDETKYPRDKDRIELYYFTAVFSHEAGTKNELNVKTDHEWQKLKDIALIEYCDYKGEDAILFVP